MSIAELSRNVEKLRFMAKAKEAEERRKLEANPGVKSESKWVSIPHVTESLIAQPAKAEPLKGKSITPRRSFGGTNAFLEQRTNPPTLKK